MIGASFRVSYLWLARDLFSVLLAVLNTSVGGIGALQGIPEGPERISWRRES